MDAIEYVIQKQRLCKGRRCSGCVIEEECRMAKADQLNAERMVEKVEQWAKDHPVKTRQSEFLKMFPNARLDDDGVLAISPCVVDRNIKVNNNDNCLHNECLDCAKLYWLQEME